MSENGEHNQQEELREYHTKVEAELQLRLERLAEIERRISVIRSGLQDSQERTSIMRGDTQRVLALTRYRASRQRALEGLMIERTQAVEDIERARERLESVTLEIGAQRDDVSETE